MSKNLEQMRYGKEMIRECEKKGWTVRRGKGSHVVVENPETHQSTCIPDHGELHKGIRLKLVKTLLGMGLLASIVVMFMGH